MGRRTLAALVVLAALAVGGCDSGTSGGDTSSVQPSVAEKLATIEANGPPDDALVERFDRQLRALQTKCKDAPIRLSDYTVKAQQLLAKEGEDESLLSIIGHVNQSIPGSAPRMPCDSVFAAYVTLRTAG